MVLRMYSPHIEKTEPCGLYKDCSSTTSYQVLPKKGQTSQWICPNKAWVLIETHRIQPSINQSIINSKNLFPYNFGKMLRVG